MPVTIENGVSGARILKSSSNKLKRRMSKIQLLPAEVLDELHQRYDRGSTGKENAQWLRGLGYLTEIAEGTAIQQVNAYRRKYLFTPRSASDVPDQYWEPVLTTLNQRADPIVALSDMLGMAVGRIRRGVAMENDALGNQRTPPKNKINEDIRTAMELAGKLFEMEVAAGLRVEPSRSLQVPTPISEAPKEEGGAVNGVVDGETAQDGFSEKALRMIEKVQETAADVIEGEVDAERTSQAVAK